MLFMCCAKKLIKMKFCCEVHSQINLVAYSISCVCDCLFYDNLSVAVAQ